MTRRLIAALAAMMSLMGTTASASSSTEPAGSDVQPISIGYGDEPSQFGELWLPAASDQRGDGDVPVVVLIHGGFWRAQYGLDLMDPLAADLVARGFAVWNLEYRRVGEPGGGWPGTLNDVAAAIDALAGLAAEHHLDLDRVAVVGHSAGGHLAFWSAGRALLPAGAPGAEPVVEPTLVIGLGAVADLEAAASDGVGGSAVVDLVGGSPTERPDRYAVATPVIPAGVRAVSIRGDDDRIVPAAYTEPAGSGDVEIIDVAGEDHFDLIDPASESWRHVVATLDAWLDASDAV